MMRATAILALAACGCAGLAGNRPPGWGASRFLPGAGEEVTVIAEPDEPIGGVGPGAEMPRERLSRIGVRGGVFASGPGPSSDWAEYRPGPLLGVFYRGLHLAEKSLAVEAALEGAGTYSDAGGDDSSLYCLRGSILYGKWYSESSTKFYLVAGGALIVENNEIEGWMKCGSLDLGGGVSFKEKWDARLGLSFLVGSQNAPGIVTGTVGYLF